MKDKILQEVAEATSLREGTSGVEALLRAVHRNESGRLADAAREARLPLPVATAVRRELEKRGVLMRQHGLAFTESGEEWVREKLGFGALLEIDVHACRTNSSRSSARWKPILPPHRALT